MPKEIAGVFSLRIVSFSTVSKVTSMLQEADPASEYTVTRDTKGRPLASIYKITGPTTHPRAREAPQSKPYRCPGNRTRTDPAWPATLQCGCTSKHEHRATQLRRTAPLSAAAAVLRP